MTHTITLNELDLNITYSVKDDSVRGCHSVLGYDLKVGDQIVIDNYFHEIIDEPAPDNNDVCVLDLLGDIDAGDYGDRLNDYRNSNDYICDIIHEIVDNDVSIYYCDILDFIIRKPDSLREVIEEGLYDPSRNYDLYQHAQCAEYMMIERDIYEHITDALMIAAVNYIRYDIEREFIPIELADALRDICDEIDNNDRMSELTDKINEWLDDYDNRAFNEFCENMGDCDNCPYYNCKLLSECKAAFERDNKEVM